MSTTAIAWALRLPLPPRTSSAKALLLVLAFLSRPTRTKKLECFPSVGYLVSATGQNRKTIIANLDKLECWGLLCDTGRRMGVTRQVVVYRLHMRAKLSTRLPQGYAQAKKRRPKTAEKTPENRSQASRKRDTDSFTKNYIKSSCAPAGAPAPVRDATADSASEGAGAARNSALAEIDQLIATALPGRRATPAAMRDAPEADPPHGGAA